MKEIQDLTYLSWTKIRHSSGTAGSFLKAYSQLGGSKIYYKLSNYDSIRGIVGHESVNECIVDRLLNILGVEHLNYELIPADVLINGKIINTYVCASENFRKPGEEKQLLDIFYESERLNEESPLDFCIRMGWEKYIWEMLVVDYLILNRDRHGANTEVLRNKNDHTFRLSPLFDHGLSLLCRCETEEDAEKFNVMDDLPIQCFVGSKSAKENLKLIPKNKMPKLNPLKEEHKNFILKDLDPAISVKLQNKIWEMIWKRWCYYEDFCHSRC